MKKKKWVSGQLLRDPLFPCFQQLRKSTCMLLVFNLSTFVKAFCNSFVSSRAVVIRIVERSGGKDVQVCL